MSVIPVLDKIDIPIPPLILVQAREGKQEEVMREETA